MMNLIADFTVSTGFTGVSTPTSKSHGLRPFAALHGKSVSFEVYIDWTSRRLQYLRALNDMLFFLSGPTRDSSTSHCSRRGRMSSTCMKRYNDVMEVNSHIVH